MQIAILLYDAFTALDAVGPYEVLSRIPRAKVSFVASQPGLIQADTRCLSLQAGTALADMPNPEIVVIPGGPGCKAVEADQTTVEWIRTAHQTSKWTTSVCTGSLILGAAGVLKGLSATTHWARLNRLDSFGANPLRQRVVEQGKVITAAGVSAGIDMALLLAQREAGDTVAKAIQLGIEYDPDPPFDIGSPDKAPKHIVAAVKASLFFQEKKLGRGKK